MTQAQRPTATDAGTTADLPSWSENWRVTLEGAEQRMKHVQRAGQELQEALQEVTIAQLEDVFRTMGRMNSLLDGSREGDRPPSLLAAQPEALICFMDLAQASNRRMMELAERWRTCSMSIMQAVPEEARSEGTQDPEPNREGTASRKVNRSPVRESEQPFTDASQAG